MMAGSKPTAISADRELTITRLLDAPPSLVWKMWTRPEHLVHWWGPKEFSAPELDLDVRPGGRYRMQIIGGDGTIYWMRGEYREVVEPERLVFTFAWEDAEGQPVHETLVTVTFDDAGDGQTNFTFHQALFRDKKERDDHNEGWSECFDRLEVYAKEIA